MAASSIGFKRTASAPKGLSIEGTTLTEGNFFYPSEKFVLQSFEMLRTQVARGLLVCSEDSILSYSNAQEFHRRVMDPSISTSTAAAVAAGDGSGGGGNIPGLAKVATTGLFGDLVDAPYIPKTAADLGAVAVVPGKMLSTNDFDAAQKNKLAELFNYDDAYVRAVLQNLLDTKVEKQTGYSLSQSNFTPAEKTKLAGVEGPMFRGTFTSLSALTAGVSLPVAGNYADVDVAGADVARYIWDASDNKWVLSSSSATPVTASQVKTLYESNPDTNAYVTADKDKLTGVAVGATKNDTDASLRDRGTHTGTQDINTINGLSTSLSTLSQGVSGAATKTEIANLASRTDLAGLASKTDLSGLISDVSASLPGQFTRSNGSWNKLVFPSRPLLREVILFGDSRTEMNHAVTGLAATASSTAFSTKNYGIYNWVAMLTGVIRLPYTLNFGIGGQNTAEMLARVEAVAAAVGDIVFFLGSTNDRTASAPAMTAGDSKRNITAIIRRLQRAGKIVIVGNETPRFGDKVLTGQALADHIEVHNWITNEVSKWTPVVNTWDAIVEADLRDGLHPHVQGAFKLAQPYLPLVRRLEFLPVDLPVDSGDLYSAVNKTGSLGANPLLLGSSNMSTASVNPTAGSVVATGFKAAGSAFTGLTTTWSKEVRTDGPGEYQVIQFGGTPSVAAAYLAFSPTTTFSLANMAVGDVFSLVGAIRVDGTTSGILGVTAEVLVTKPVNSASTVFYFRDGDKYVDPYTLPAVVPLTSLETQRYTWDGTETAVTVRVTVYFAQNVAQDSVVRIGQFAPRKHI
ncbi:lipase [Pseudomonas phage vB_PpuM-Amme-1]